MRGATNPFADPDAKYLVLINDEGQHSLWPIFADVPDGWEVIFGEDGRQECLDFIENVSGNGASGNGSAAAKKLNGSRASKTPKTETVGGK
jgi:MbtH protein